MSSSTIKFPQAQHPEWRCSPKPIGLHNLLSFAISPTSASPDFGHLIEQEYTEIQYDLVREELQHHKTQMETRKATMRMCGNPNAVCEPRQSSKAELRRRNSPIDSTYPGHCGSLDLPDFGDYFDLEAFGPELIAKEGDSGEVGDELLMKEVAKKVREKVAEMWDKKDLEKGMGKKTERGVKEAKRKVEEWGNKEAAMEEIEEGPELHEQLKLDKLKLEDDDEWEEEKEEKEENAEIGRRDCIYTIQSNHNGVPIQYSGGRRTDTQLDLLGKQSQQSSRPRKPKSKWVIVNDFSEDCEFVFVEKGAHNSGC